MCANRSAACVVVVALVWTSALGIAAPQAHAGGGNGKGSGNGGGNGNGNGNDADVLELTGIIRDFRSSHPDFDITNPPDGYGQSMWNVATEPGDFDRPVYLGGGAKVLQHAHDIEGRPICWTIYDPEAGDTPAVPDNADNGNITSAETFLEWFRDFPAVNMSDYLTVSGPLREDGEYAGMYEINIPQFYPIDDKLLGNEGANHNRSFTFEITGDFLYEEAADYRILFKTDDDGWIFVDDRLVADLGGINGTVEQWVDMNRLELTEGETYRVRIFMADRSGASSRFHLITNVPLTSSTGQTVSAIYD